MQVNDVLVVGAGVGGLAVSAALAQRGVNVDLVEVTSKPEVYGVGINQPANSLRALDYLGVLDEILERGFVHDRITFMDWQDNLVVDIQSILGDDRVPANVGLSRLDLYEALSGAVTKAGVDIQFGVTVEDMGDPEADRVTVTLTNGVTKDYDLVVAFDGVKSPMRRRLFGEVHEPVFSGYGVWRLTRPRPAEIRNTLVFQGNATKSGVIPLSEESMYMFLVHAEPAGTKYDPAEFDTMLRERLDGYGGTMGAIRDSIDGPEGIVYSPLNEVFLPNPWGKGRVLVLGDAAHACAPHLTQGAGMALEDAVVLSMMLDEPGDLLETLPAYFERRIPRAQLVQDASHGILMAEQAITVDNMTESFEHMRAELPGQTAYVETVLNSPF